LIVGVAILQWWHRDAVFAKTRESFLTSPNSWFIKIDFVSSGGQEGIMYLDSTNGSAEARQQLFVTVANADRVMYVSLDRVTKL
jgi:hypothetical protein